MCLKEAEGINHSQTELPVNKALHVTLFQQSTPQNQQWKTSHVFLKAVCESASSSFTCIFPIYSRTDFPILSSALFIRSVTEWDVPVSIIPFEF